MSHSLMDMFLLSFSTDYVIVTTTAFVTATAAWTKLKQTGETAERKGVGGSAAGRYTTW